MMKPTAYIFTALLLFLNVQPVLLDCKAMMMRPCETSPPPCAIKKSCARVKNTCTKKSKDTRPGNKSNEPTAGCNPFASCSQCCYIAAYKSIGIKPVLPLVKVTLFTSNEEIQSGFLKDCWHPPEYSRS